MESLRNLSHDRANDRSQQGLERVSESQTNNHSHPSFGGSHGYDLWFREDVLSHESLYGIKSAADYFGVSMASIYRWKKRLYPSQQTGNREKGTLTGLDQYLMVVGLFLYPRMSNNQLSVFITINGGSVGITNEALSRRCGELNITRKRASLEAYAAFLPVNRRRAVNFFRCGPRVGIYGVPFYKMVDFDEACFCLSGIESSTGRALSCIRVRDGGHYSRMSPGLTLILGIEPGNPFIPPHIYGSIQNPRKWFRILTKNVDQVVFADFLDEVCKDIEQNPVPGGYDDSRLFLWDNLAAHQTGLVITTIEYRPDPDQSSFIAVPCPPYQPKYAPIEYAFCEISCLLSEMIQPNWKLVDLRNAILDCIVRLGRDCKFNRTFNHCLNPHNHPEI